MDDTATLRQRSLPGSDGAGDGVSGDGPLDGRSALEDDDFPIDAISDIAELESWRKEINRPVYHIHKWWAQRLGTVFRAVTLGALMPSGTDVLEAFYSRTRLAGRSSTCSGGTRAIRTATGTRSSIW